MSKEIALNERGMMRPTTMSEAMEFAKLVAGSTLVPAPYRGKPGDVLLAIQMGAELGLAPMQALQSVAVINGKPSLYGDALMALVRGSPICESVAETYQGEGENFTAVCVARRRGQADPIVARFSIADAKRAKLWGKSGPWADYPKVMLKHRARGFCLRDGFADLLHGIVTVEEAEDYTADPRRPREIVDVTPPAPPRPRREDYADDPQVDGEIGEIIEAGEAATDQSDTDPEARTYWVVNLEGVEIECPTAAAAERQLTEIFAEAKRRGKPALGAAAQDNHAAFEGLEASGHADIVEGLRQIYRDAIAAEPGPAAERRQTTKPNVTRVTEPASQQGQEASPPPHSKTAERPGLTDSPNGSGRGDLQPGSSAATGPAEERSGAATERGDPAPERPMTAEDRSRAALWRGSSFYIEPPLLPNTDRINFPILRDMLCNMAAAAHTRDEISKLETDNQPNLRRLIEAFPQYGEQVARAIADAKQRIGSA